MSIDTDFMGQLVAGLLALGSGLGVVVSAAMYIKGLQAKADSAETQAKEANEKAKSADVGAKSAHDDLATYKTFVAQTYATKTDFDRMGEKFDRSFEALRKEIKGDTTALQDLILKFLKTES